MLFPSLHSFIFFFILRHLQPLLNCPSSKSTTGLKSATFKFDDRTCTNLRCVIRRKVPSANALSLRVRNIKPLSFNYGSAAGTDSFSFYLQSSHIHTYIYDNDFLYIFCYSFFFVFHPDSTFWRASYHRPPMTASQFARKPAAIRGF